MLKIRNRIQSCLKKNARVFNLKVAFQSTNNFPRYLLSQIKSTKCSSEYNICDDIYYGKTKCHFKLRACEHLGITPLTGKKGKSPKESAVFNDIGYNASFDDFEILVKESDEFWTPPLKVVFDTA